MDDAFARTGTTHLLAVSGLQLQVLAWAIGMVLVVLGVPRRLRYALVALSAAVALLYAATVGGVGALLGARGAPWLGWLGAGVVAVSFAPLRDSPTVDLGGGRTKGVRQALLSCAVPFAQGPFPAISVPAGHTADGLPLAVQLVGRPGAEALLLGLAAQLERSTSFADRRPSL